MDTSAVPLSCEHRGEHGGAAMRREEQLRTTLHCDDKEKLRRKLALLQREYLKTAERLQRAERLDAVRRHVRSRIGLRDQDQDQGDPRDTPGPDGTVPGVAGAGVSDAPGKSPMIQFLLPCDAVGPPTPDPRHHAAEGHRPSPALRLRSRRSRLRWERRSAEAGESTDDNGEEPRERSDGTATAGAGGRHGGVGTEFVYESEEPLSESPSLLLSQWNAPGPAGTGGNEGEENRLTEKHGELASRAAAAAAGETEQGGTGRETGGGQEGEKSREESDGRDTSPDNAAGFKEEESELTGGERDGKGSRLLDSCTLVEGLLYPAEYYVRTTRRMALSQSQADMQPVIFSQLSAGRHRTRGPRRSGGRIAAEMTDQMPGGEIDAGARVPPPAAACPARGRGKGRGRGRGAGRPPSLQPKQQRRGPGATSGDPRPPSPAPSGADGPREAAPVRDEPEAASARGADTPPCSGEAQPGSASGHTEVFPIFVRSEVNGSRRTSRSSAACWRSLLLPSSPPATTALLPRPSMFPAPFFNNLLNFDFPQDFHLPDEQFASLKLLKLRQVAAYPGVERLASPARDNRAARRRPDGSGEPVALPLSPTPTLSSETEETPRGDVREIPGKRSVRVCGARHEERAAGSPERLVGAPPRSDAANGPAGQVAEGESGARPKDHRAEGPPRPPEEPEDSGGGAAPGGDSKEPSDPPATPQSDPRRRVPSQLLLSPPGPSMTSHPAVLCSPTLPSLGLSPRPLCTALPPPSSPAPCAPSLTSSPAAQVLSPRPAAPPAGAIGAPSSREEPPDPPTGIQYQGSAEHVMRSTHTLEAPAGGRLVDACCLRGSSGALCVAAAAAWTVCLWSQTPAADWRLTHTWAFSKPVINVFAVPDAAGLLCVTLGPLEITEVRVLSCSLLSQAPLCQGAVQAVVGVPESRVVTSSHSPSGSTLRVFTASDSGRTSSSQPLAPPGVLVRALAPVDGLSEALIGSDDGGRLFVWNLKTGQLLRRIALGDGLSHTSCLRGFSSRGALFVLLQHQQLGSPQDGAKEDEDEEQESHAPFSLVAVDPLSGRSAVASRLRPPEGWTGRLCEADVGGGGAVVGLSRSGCAGVWELGVRGAPRMVGAPGADGWQLARWGAGGTLVTGHHNGDVTLHGGFSSKRNISDRHCF
ncbi:uncharacterized protein palb2 isoform 2-T2 [Spinachia spinachia]